MTRSSNRTRRDSRDSSGQPGHRDHIEGREKADRLPITPATALKVVVYNRSVSEPFWGCGCSGDKEGDYICGRCKDHCECPAARDHDSITGSGRRVPRRITSRLTCNLTEEGMPYAKDGGFPLH